MLKRILGLLFLGGIVIGCGTTSQIEKNPVSAQASETSSQIFDCKDKEYYTNLSGSGSFTLKRDEAESGFSVSIPELYVKLTAHMPSAAIEYFTGGIEEWKNYYLQNEGRLQLFSGYWINNKIVIGGSGYSNYIFKDKQSSLSIQEAINYDYGIGDFDEAQPPILLFGKAICNVVPKVGAYWENRLLSSTPQIAGDSENVRYTILTPEVIADQHGEQYLDIYSPICGYQYPAEDLGFLQTWTYDILYSKNHPTTYILYNSFLGHDDSNPLLNMTIEFLK